MNKLLSFVTGITPRSARNTFAFVHNYYSTPIMEPKNHDNIVWVDLEMTGLDIETDSIMEIACIVTDSQLNILDEGMNLIVHQSDEALNKMGDWCTTQHGQTGLTEACRKSSIDVKDAEKKVLSYIKKFTAEGRSPLAGSSIYMDRLFLRKHMPLMDAYLHYRIIDVSTIKELSRRWFPQEYLNLPKKTFQHRTLSDIRESIAELKYYRENIFKS